MNLMYIIGNSMPNLQIIKKITNMKRQTESAYSNRIKNKIKITTAHHWRL